MIRRTLMTRPKLSTEPDRGSAFGAALGKAIAHARAALRRDARLGQILCLATLLVAGVFALDFRIPPLQPLAIGATALAVQVAAMRLLRLRIDVLSALITAFSLTFLLRTGEPWLAVAAAALAIGSKFLIRFNGRHVFNPANFGLVCVTLAADAAWISPGQWGALGLAAILLAAAGAAVAGSAGRLDSALGFLGAWAALLFGRALWFGDPLAIPLHQLQSGAVLIFAFFMISDPATTPRSRKLRLLHAAAVAGLGFWLQMEWISETGPIHALILLAPAIAVIDWAVLGRRAALPSRPSPASPAAPPSPPASSSPNRAPHGAVPAPSPTDRETVSCPSPLGSAPLAESTPSPLSPSPPSP